MMPAGVKKNSLPTRQVAYYIEDHGAKIPNSFPEISL